jgi:hypothetical protein
MTAAKKKPRGRPRRYLGERPNWTIRLEEKYGDQIREIAEQSGRSISEVCEQQIVNSFRMDIMLDLLETKYRDLETSRDSLRLRVEELVSLLAASEDKRGQIAFAEIEKLVGNRRSREPRVFGRPVKNTKRRSGHARGSI